MPPLAPRSERLRITLALTAVYLIWGSTYLGVHIALTACPPLLLAGIRYGTAGALLYTWLRARGVPRPTWAEWRTSGLIGLVLMSSTAATAYTLRVVPTGIASVASGAVPLWSALLAHLWGERARPREWLGLAIGFFGIVLLNAKSELSAHVFEAVVLAAASVLWSVGALLGRFSKQPRGAMASAVQMLTGGWTIALTGLVVGERIEAVPGPKPLAAFAYLVLVGSIIGYSAFAYLLPRVRTGLGTSYAYVNPIVALVLGVTFLDERLTGSTIVASLFALGGVAILGFAAVPKVGGVEAARASRATS
jgi:drug/metabolite transporter (DMT)-like permease